MSDLNLKSNFSESNLRHDNNLLNERDQAWERVLHEQDLMCHDQEYVKNYSYKDLEINKIEVSKSKNIFGLKNLDSNSQVQLEDPLDQFKISSGSGYFGQSNTAFMKPSSGQNKNTGNAFLLNSEIRDVGCNKDMFGMNSFPDLFGNKNTIENQPKNQTENLATIVAKDDGTFTLKNQTAQPEKTIFNQNSSMFTNPGTFNS